LAPPQFRKVRDVMRVEVQSGGAIENTVVAEPA
jgi:hypothetical protein